MQSLSLRLRLSAPPLRHRCYARIICRRHSRSRRQQAPQRFHRPLQRHTTSKIGPAAPRATRAKIAALPADERAEWDAEMKKGINEHWHVDNGELVSDGKDPFLATTRRLRRFRNVGRLEDRHERRQRHLSPRRAAGPDLGSVRRRSATSSAPTKAPADSGTTRSTRRFPPVSPTNRSASGTACTSAWSARTSR